MKKLKEFEIQNAELKKIMGGTHYICVGYTGRAGGGTYYDYVLTGADGSWIGDPVCDCPDTAYPEIGDEVDPCDLTNRLSLGNTAAVSSSSYFSFK